MFMIWDLYNVAVNREYDANVIMTLTSPTRPSGRNIMEVEFASRAVECINKVKVTLTFDLWN